MLFSSRQYKPFPLDENPPDLISCCAGLVLRRRMLEVLLLSRRSTGSQCLHPVQTLLPVLIYHRYVLNAAKEAKSKDPNHPQRLVYVSVGVHVVL